MGLLPTLPKITKNELPRIIPYENRTPTITPPIAEPMPTVTGEPTPFIPRSQPPQEDPGRFFSDYDDPFQINSFADAVLTTFNQDMDRREWGGLEQVPFANILTSTMDVMYDTTVKPAMHGEWEAVGINLLINMGETLDVLSNPIKAYLMTGGEGIDNLSTHFLPTEDKLQAVLNAMGWGGEGRHNYDWDTGTLAGNIALEILSCPLNWATTFIKKPVTLLTRGAVARGLAETAGEAGQRFVREMGQQTVDRSFSRLADRAVRAYLQKDYKTLNDAVINIAQNMHKASPVFKTAPLPEEVLHTIMRSADLGQDIMTVRVLKGVKGLSTAADNLTRQLFRGAFTSAGIYPTWWALSKGRSSLQAYKAARATKGFNRFTYHDGTISVLDFEPAMDLWGRNLDDLSIINRAENIGEMIPPKMFRNFMDQSVQFEKKTLQDMLMKYNDDFSGLMKAMRNHLQGKHKVRDLKEYLSGVKRINRKYNGLFQDFENFLKHTEETVRKKGEYFRKEAEIKKVQAIRDKEEGVFELIRRNVPAPDQEYSQKLDFEKAVGAAMRKELEPYGPQFIFKDASKRELAEVIERVNLSVEAAAKETFTPLLRELGVDSPAYQEAYRIVRQHIDDIQHQIDYTFRHYHAGKIEKIKLDYKRKHPFQQLENLAEERYVDYNHTIDRLSIDFDETTFYKELAKIKDKNVGVEGRVYQEVISDQTVKRVMNEWGQTVADSKSVPVTKEQIKITVDTIYTKLNELYEHFTPDEVASIMSDSPQEAFLSALNEFSTIDPTTNTHGFLRTWEELHKQTIRLIDNISENIPKYDEVKGIDIEEYRHFTADEAALIISRPSPEISISALDRFATIKTWEEIQKQTVRRPESIGKGVQKSIDVEKLEELVEVIENLNPSKVISAKTTLRGKMINYAVKVESGHVALDLLDSPELNNLVKSIVAEDNLGKAIQTYAKAGSEQAQQSCAEIIQAAEKYVHYLNFVEDLVHSNIDDKVRWAFFSAVNHQMTARTTPGAVSGMLDWHFNNVIERTVDHINYTSLEHMKHSLSLDALIPKSTYSEGVRHTGAGDVDRLIQVVKSQLSDVFDNPQIHYELADIETTGTNPHINSMMEIASRGLDDSYENTFEVLRNWDTLDSTDYPRQSLMRKMMGDADTYINRYKQGTHNEFEMFNDYIAYLKNKESVTGKQLVLGFHGGDNFDIPVITARMREAGVAPEDIRFFENIPKIDTLKELRKKEGFFDLSHTDNDYQELYRLFKESVRRANEKGFDRLFDPANKELVSSMDKFIGELNRIDRLGSISLQEQAMRGQKDMITGNEVIEYLQNTTNALKEKLRVTTQHNDALRWNYFSNQWLESSASKSRYIKFLAKEMNISIDEASKQVGDHLGAGKLMYGTSDPGSHYLGFVHRENHDLITDWFNYNLGDSIPHDHAASLTKLGKTLDSKYNAIKNPHRIKAYEDVIDDSIKILLERRDPLPKSFKDIIDGDYELYAGFSSETFYKNLRIDHQDTTSKYVILEYLYNSRYEQDLLSDDMIRRLNELGTTELLNKENRSLIYGSRIPGHTETLIQRRASTLDIDYRFASPRERRAVAEEINGLAEGFKNAGRVYDEYSFANKTRQMLSATMQKASDMVDHHVGKTFKLQEEALPKLYNHYDSLGEQQLVNILQLDDETLLQHMAHNAPFFEFNIEDLTRQEGLIELYNNFINRKSSLRRWGIEVFDTPDRVYVGLSKHTKLSAYAQQGEHFVTINGRQISKPILKELDFDYAKQFLDDDVMDGLCRETREVLRYLGGDKVVGSTGEIVKSDFYEKMYQQLPERFKNMIMPLEDIQNPELFIETRYNFTNLGRTASRKMKDEFTPSSVLSSHLRATEETARQVDRAVGYTMLYYDDMYSINNGFMANLSNEEVIRAMQETPYMTLSALVEAPGTRYGYKVINFDPVASEVIDEARRLNAVIMPKSTYAGVYEVINSGFLKDGKLGWWQKVMYAYKAGFLLDPGVWFRNWIDSTMKTLASGGELGEAANCQLRAAKLLRDYDQVVDDVIKLDTAYGGKVLKENMDTYFNSGKAPIDRELWEWVNSFIHDGPSAGLTGRWGKYYEMKNEELMSMYAAFVHHSRKLMHPNSYIEQIHRLGYYMQLTEKGQTTIEAYHNLAKVHFDYAFKSEWEKTAELVIPFYSFTMRNLEYWADTVNQHPWVAKMFRDVYMPIADFDEIDHYELARNRSLQYRILAGNTPLYREEGFEFTAKTAPSIMDAFRLVSNPLGNLQSRLAPPFQEVVNQGLGFGGSEDGFLEGTFGQPQQGMIDQAAGLFPVAGAAYQRYVEGAQRHSERTGSDLHKILPGVFGSTMRFRDFEPRGYPRHFFSPSSRPSSYGYTQRGFYGRRSYPRRIYPERVWGRRVFHDRAYADRHFTRRAYPQHTPGMRYTRSKSYESFYHKHYTPTGVSRMKMRMQPVTSENLKYRIKDMWGHYRKR